MVTDALLEIVSMYAGLNGHMRSRPKTAGHLPKGCVISWDSKPTKRMELYKVGISREGLYV